MPMIEFEWEMKIPNDYLVDHSQSEGKTRTCVYDGPDKIYLIVNNETGKEDYGPITEREKNDGRPVPTGCRYVEVDCTENPLVCQLRGPVIDEVEEDNEIEEPHPHSPEIEGYPRYSRWWPILARDVYNGMDLTIDKNDNITVPVFTLAQHMFNRDTLPTWEDVRRERNQLLTSSDSQFTEDMPAEIKNEWLQYRQRLRDITTKLADVPAHIAFMMMPIPPFSDPPEDEEE